MNRKYSLVIFDWDGTLINSVPNIVQALSLGAEQLRLPVLDETCYKGVIGLSLGNAARSLYPDLGEDEMVGFIRAYRQHYLSLEQSPSAPFPGVTDGLDWLKGRGTRMAVATGKGRPGLDRSLKANRYENYFAASRCADETRSKPHPLMLEQLLDELQVSVDEALMVGDSGFDLEMEACMGMERVAVTYGAQSRDELLKHDPVCVADSFDDLVRWLEGRGVNRMSRGV